MVKTVINSTRPNNSVKDRGCGLLSVAPTILALARPVGVKGMTAEGVRRKITWGHKIRFVQLSLFAECYYN